MRTPESPFSTRATPTTPHTSAAVPTPATTMPGHTTPAFGQVFTQVQSEVQAFIAHGAQQDSPPALHFSGWLLHQRLSAQPHVGTTATSADLSQQQAAFMANIAPWTEEAAQQTGVAPELIAAHAALESGWGRSPLRHPDGRDTHNLFSLKATPQWQGERAHLVTTEYTDGQANVQREPFRSYPDYASAFADYAKLLKHNPRYRDALHTGGDATAFAKGLARGGYATDPDYADKLNTVARQIQRATRQPAGD